MPEAFTTLANAKAWLNLPATVTASDFIIQRLIYASTNAIKAYCSLDTLLYSQRQDAVNGTGAPGMYLSAAPVQSVLSLSVDGQTVPASTSGTSGVGFSLSPASKNAPASLQTLSLNGYGYGRGLANVVVTYMAGYAVLNEPVTVPAAGAVVAVAQNNGPFARDEGVTYATTGTPLVKVTGAPAAGQYALDATTLGGYKFNTADAAAQVLVSYSYVPFDLEQACIETVAERFRYMSRIGETTKTLGGQETVSYDISDLNKHVKTLLSAYMQVVSPTC